MRSDLGRLDAIAEILQVGPFLTRADTLGVAFPTVVYCRQNAGSIRMRIFRAAAVLVLLTGPAYAQTPHVNLLADTPSKTPEEIEKEEAQQKAYKESLRKIPDAKVSSDPWGNVRTEAPKTPAPAKPKTKTGSTQTKTETR
jgi:hypothetical protein